MARIEQIPRQWRILRRLEVHRYGLSADDLAKEENCPIRTIYRDLADLQEAGFPLVTEQRGKRSLWKLAFQRGTPNIPFVFSEICALWISRGFRNLWKGTEWYESMGTAFEKIRAMLPPGVLEHLEEFENKVVVRNLEMAESLGEILPQINAALEANERIEITYASAGNRGQTVRKIDPYRLWIQDHVMYLIAYCHLRKDLRTFHMSRIKKITPLGEYFEDNPEFDLEAYLAGTFRAMGGEVMEFEILFDPEVKHVAQERIWHASQETIEQEDGRVLFRFKTGGLPEVKSWVLGFGPRVEVLNPPALRNAIIQDLAAATKRYQNSST